MFTFSNYLSVTVNGITTPTDKFIEVYTSAETGSYDPDNIFWGNNSASDTFIFNSWLSIVINGDTYWMPIYKASNSVADCSSNLVGTASSDGVYTNAGYVAINENNTTTKWLIVYTK